MLIGVCGGMDHGQAGHSSPHKDEAAGLWSKRLVPLVPQVLHHQLVLGPIELGKIAVKDCNRGDSFSKTMMMRDVSALLTERNGHLNFILDLGVPVGKVLQVDKHFLIHECFNFVHMTCNF